MSGPRVAGSGARNRAARCGVRACHALVLVTAVFAQGCAPEPTPTPVDRSDRYAVFRDLVWFQPSANGGGGFFLDLFEATQGDWRAFRTARGDDSESVDSFLAWWSAASPIDRSYPVVGVSHAEAREFCQWRFGRLPRAEEWRFAATARGRYDLPWGNLPRTAYANSVQLGHSALAPVGSFESGRQPGGPFDLIGNAGEWTETIAVDWDASPFGDAWSLEWRIESARANPALSVWWSTVRPMPQWALVAARSGRVPRVVIAGADRPMPESGARGRRLEPLALYPTERHSMVGIRLATDPLTLVRGLAAETTLPGPAEVRVLRRFLRQHASVLRPAWNRCAAELEELELERSKGPFAPDAISPAPNPMLELLATEIGA